MPSAAPDVYTAKEVARKLRLSPTHFYAQREQLHTLDQMPRPVTSSRHMRFEKSGIDCWLLRHHPYAPKQPPANDLLPRPLELEDERAELAREYAR